MKQLNVFCEGQTEQGFCAQVLQPHLFPSGDGILPRQQRRSYTNPKRERGIRCVSLAGASG